MTYRKFLCLALILAGSHVGGLGQTTPSPGGAAPTAVPDLPGNKARKARGKAPNGQALDKGVGGATQDEAPKTPAEPDRNAAWRESARQRIEEIRKANLEIKVIDANGKPIPDAAVTVQMTRHAFGFGMLMNTTRWDDRPNAADARRHLALLAERFNKVVIIPRADEPASARALDWLAGHGIRVRGHYLMWAPLQPDVGRRGQPKAAFTLPVKELADKADARQRETIREAAFAHVEQMLKFAGDRVAEWDAVNHIANDAHVRYSDVFGVQLYADVIKRARELAPHAQMWVNEGNVIEEGNRLQKYHDVVAELIATGTKPDGLGFMAHFREGKFTPPEEIYRRLSRFAELVPNLQLTELDIDTADEQAQADYLREVLTVAFSHPAVSGIVMWQVWGDAAGRKALWRPDWSIKPAGQAWLDQVWREWATQLAGPTDAAGTFKGRGFLGTYKITAKAGDKTKEVDLQLNRGGGTATIAF
jgi:endo-1,4-beta-xylanase